VTGVPLALHTSTSPVTLCGFLQQSSIFGHRGQTLSKKQEGIMTSINCKIGILVFTSIILVSVFLTGCATAPSPAKPAAGLSAQLVKLKTRPGVMQKFILIKPANPIASVLLFAGGKGNLKLSSLFGKPSVGGGRNIFVVRTRKDFAKHGFMVALVDAPSDQKSDKGMLKYSKKNNEIFRGSNEHAQDIKAVVTYLKNEANIPVWLVGTSWGTISATNGAVRIKDGIDGLVLTSTMTRGDPAWPKKVQDGVLAMGLNKIIIPSLIVSHKDDNCFATPSSDAPKIKEGFVNSPKVEIMYFTGGKRAIENECWGLSAHGFYGIEEEVVSAIADFIKSNSK